VNAFAGATSLLLAASLLAAGRGAALAQSEQEAVVVSATRVEQRGFDVPASIDRLLADDIRQFQPKVNLSESIGRVPGIDVQNRSNYAQDLRVQSRGFGARAAFGVRGVRLIADGIPATMPDGAGQASTFSLGSAGRIEVLRGPLSGLYGNASGGVVQIFTAEGPRQPTVSGEIWAGGYDSSRISLQAGGEAGSLNYLLDASRFDTAGYRDHSAAKRDHANARLKFDLGDGSRLTLVANALNQPGTLDPLGLTRAQFDANPRQADPAATLFNTRKSVGQTQFGISWTKMLSAADELRLSAYDGRRDVIQHLGFSGTAITSSGGVISLDREYSGIGLRWVRRTELAARSLVLVAGADWDSMKERRQGFVNDNGVSGALRRDENDRATNTDAYLLAQWKLAQRWTATAGVRASRVSVSFDDRFIVAGNPDDSGRVRFSAVLPAAGIVFHAAPALNLYASAGRGFETPTLAELAYRPGGTGPNLDLKPARSRQWEAGVKAILFGSSSLNVALFGITTSDEIVVNTSAGGRTTFKNASRTRRDGLELAWDLPLPRDFAVHLAYTRLNARFSEPFTSGGPVAAGNLLPAVPRTLWRAELAWRHPESGFGAALEIRHSGRLFVDDMNSESADPYTVANLRAGFEHALGPWKATLFARVENLFDRNYAGSVIVADSNRRFYEPAPRRNGLIGVTLSHAF
jgi:iron complex outermembrane receptor protein